MERIRELLGRIAELTADELTELRELIGTTFEDLDKEDAEVTPEVVAQMNELAEAGEAAMVESGKRDAAAAEATAAAQAARDRIAAMNAEPEQPAEDAAAGEAEAPEAEATGATEGEDPEKPAKPAQTPAPVVASGTGAVRRMAARQTTPQRSPEASAPEVNRAVLTASGALRGDLRGKEITDRYAFAGAMADTLTRLPRFGAPTGDVLLASATWQYPESRQLGDDMTRNAELMDAVTHPDALVATGGICTPVAVDYTVPTWATAQRPLRDGLPAFGADRGGIRFVQPPDIAALASATGLWTAAVDAAPGAATKPILQVTCGSEVQVLVDAVTTRLQYGNMMSRFAPEQIAANTDLAMAAAARFAEVNLLNKIAASCVTGVTNGTVAVLGATRDLVSVLEQTIAAYRYTHRMPDSTVFTAIFPDWLKGLIKIDLAREIGHAQDAVWNSLMISDEQVNELLRAHGVNAIWHLDGQPARGSGTTYPLQGFTIPAASTQHPLFPTKVVWYFFPEGTFQFLDAGRLDLGVVRDATLDATNDYEVFVETFEAIAFRGFTSGAYEMVTTLSATGATSGTAAVTATS